MGRWSRLALPLGGLLALLLSACGLPADASGQLAANQKFVWPQELEASVNDEVLDPAEISTYYDATTAAMLFSGLVTLDSNLQVVPDAAQSFKVDETGTKYTFKLRPDLAFNDGTPITAADFAYSIDRELDPHLCDVTDKDGNIVTAYHNSPYGANCFYAGGAYLDHVLLGADARINGSGGRDHSVVANGDNPNKGVSIIDDQTLVIRLEQPAAYFLEALTYPSSNVVEKALIDKYPDGKWVKHLDEGGCSGPFQPQSYADGAKDLVFVPNHKWEAAHKKLTLTEVERPFVADQDQEYTNYRSGHYDYTTVPPHDYAYARGQDDFHEVGALQIQYFGLNWLVPPFDSKEVRQAFDLALNKQILVDRILNGGGIPTNHIVPQGMPGYDPNLLTPPPDKTQSLTGNQTAAQNLLKQAAGHCVGQNDPDFCPYIDAAHYSPLQEIDMYAVGDTRIQLTKAAVDQWSLVLGLNIQEKNPYSTFSAFYRAVAEGTLPAFTIGWVADYPDPQDWLSLQFASASPANLTHVKGSDFDAAFAKADAEQNVTNRMQEYNQIEQAMVDNVAWLPYEQAKFTWRQRFWVHGFGLNSQGGFPDIAWPNVYITAH